MIPIEIIKMIFDELDTLYDILCLCVAHPLLEDIGAQRVHVLRDKIVGSFIGGRLICISDEAKKDDLPEDLLNKAEQEEIDASWPDVKWEDWQDRSRPMTLADVAQSRFTYENSHEIMETLRRRSQPWDYCGDRVKYRHDILRFKNILTPRYDERDWVLCNLSKREFVLSEAIRDLTSCDHLWGIRDGPFNSYQKVGFHTVLLARICWSSTSIAQGVWAGDCFHIMPMTRFKERMQIAEWKDASSELIAEIEEMWKREYGERWEEYL